jgi:esterase/lipase superfamily enzyme
LRHVSSVSPAQFVAQVIVLDGDMRSACSAASLQEREPMTTHSRHARTCLVSQSITSSSLASARARTESSDASARAITRRTRPSRTALWLASAAAAWICAQPACTPPGIATNDTRVPDATRAPDAAPPPDAAREPDAAPPPGAAPLPDSAPPPQAAPPPSPASASQPKLGEPGRYTEVSVFFGTDRQRVADAPNGARFGVEPDELVYGVCRVSIPRDHRMGEIERPSKFLFWQKEAPEKHVVVMNTQTLSVDAFFASIASRFDGAPVKKALVFVHGYNVSFDEAARRTAQIAYDLSFPGAPMFYSWPSQGNEDDYGADETVIEWTKPHLTAFLSSILARTDASEIYLIAHSMGNRALTQAFVDTLRDATAADKARVRALILAAPDIDARVFRRDIAPALVATGTPTTLYASSKDWALTLSKRFHKWVRAGDIEGALPAFDGIDTIDASSVATDFLGHSYIGDSASVLSDVFEIIHENRRAAERRRAIEASAGNPTHWVFKR